MTLLNEVKNPQVGTSARPQAGIASREIRPKKFLKIDRLGLEKGVFKVLKSTFDDGEIEFLSLVTG